LLAGDCIRRCGWYFQGTRNVCRAETRRDQGFDLKKGLLVGTFSGVMSACFAYGLAAGDPIKTITIEHGTPAVWQELPVLVVLLAGGFTTNFRP